MKDDDDFQLQNYQDDLDTEFEDVDPLMEEEADDPTEDLHIPPEELEEELAKLDSENEDNDEDASGPAENSRQDRGY